MKYGLHYRGEFINLWCSAHWDTAIFKRLAFAI